MENDNNKIDKQILLKLDDISKDKQENDKIKFI